jgi:YtkA-like protein
VPPNPVPEVQRTPHSEFLRPRVLTVAAVVVGLLAAGLLALSPTGGRRALLAQLQRAATPAPTTVGARPARFARRSKTGYAVAMTLTPNRANGPIAMSMRVTRNGRPVRAARVRVDFSMPSMHMWNAYTAPLRATRGGSYATTIPVLGMAGAWHLRIDFAPRSGRPFAVDLNDRLAP